MLTSKMILYSIHWLTSIIYQQHEKVFTSFWLNMMKLIAFFVVLALVSDHQSKMTAEIKQIINHQMRDDDKTTAYQLHHLLSSKGYKNMDSTIHCRTHLGFPKVITKEWQVDITYFVSSF